MRILIAFWLSGAAMVSGIAGEPRQLTRPGQPISVDAASSDVDARTNSLVFHDVVISQGATRVQAQTAHATGLNFENSRWTFDGKVRIDAERHGNLRSDEAVVEFRDNRLAKATITGAPAQFEQQRADSDQTARGHADEIVYDVSDGTVRLSRDAWLSDGQNEISGPAIVYSIREEKFRASSPSGGAERVHITIAPGKPPTGRKSNAPPAPQDAPEGKPAAHEP